jgi:hypothetical protein
VDLATANGVRCVIFPRTSTCAAPIDAVGSPTKTRTFIYLRISTRGQAKAFVWSEACTT